MTIIEYISGLTSIVFDEAILTRIASDRGVLNFTDPASINQRSKDLILADLLMTAYMGPSNIPSMQQQHGQFSQSIGQQKFDNKDELYDMAMRLYRRWHDPKACLYEKAGFEWKF